MDPIELRNLEEARRFVVEGLWLQRVLKPTAATVKPALDWAMEVAASGRPLPPVGFVADVGHLLFAADAQHWTKDAVHVPGWPASLGRQYEDHVLGKLYADWTFERAGDALRRYQGKDRVKGLAYTVNQLRDRATVQAGPPRTREALLGVHLPPAVIRGLLNSNPDDVLSQGWDALMRDGPSPLLQTLYVELVAAWRRLAEVLGPEDVLALEQRTALADMGQYVAHRQILQTTARLEAGLPVRPVRPLVGRREVPTRVLDEDQYPVGGYTSISTKGSIESLLHSQLAYIDPPPAESPDLFDLKFARDELFYYSRDENQFLRRRRAFVFVFFPNLLEARFKDPELPSQRIVILQSAVLAIIRKLTAWLSTDAIRFDVLFVRDGDRQPLAEEAGLIELFLREPIERGDGRVLHVTDRKAVETHLVRLAQEAQVHCLAAAAEPFELELDAAVVTEVVVNGPRPLIGSGDGVVAELEGDDAFDVWQETVLHVLRLWV
jgi:hypothetical protein